MLFLELSKHGKTWHVPLPSKHMEEYFKELDIYEDLGALKASRPKYGSYSFLNLEKTGVQHQGLIFIRVTSDQ